ncbi:unnamed protein product [Calypogeia fissa]
MLEILQSKCWKLDSEDRSVLWCKTKILSW